MNDLFLDAFVSIFGFRQNKLTEEYGQKNEGRRIISAELRIRKHLHSPAYILLPSFSCLHSPASNTAEDLDNFSGSLHSRHNEELALSRELNLLPLLEKRGRLVSSERGSGETEGRTIRPPFGIFLVEFGQDKLPHGVMQVK